jgi:hypothetical protein
LISTGAFAVCTTDIDKERALVSLAAGSVFSDEVKAWAADRRVCISVDGKNIPLATSSAELLREMENYDKARRYDEHRRLSA